MEQKIPATDRCFKCYYWRHIPWRDAPYLHACHYCYETGYPRDRDGDTCKSFISKAEGNARQEHSRYHVSMEGRSNMDYQTNSYGKILNMNRPGIWYLASDGKPYEFRYDLLPGGKTTGFALPVQHQDETRAGARIRVGPDANRWEICFNENGYITWMSHLSGRR